MGCDCLHPMIQNIQTKYFINFEDIIMYKEITLNKLIISPDNVRTISTTKRADKELLAGIQSQGLIQNLVVKPASSKGLYEVIAGARRFAALKVMLDNQEIKKNYLVPCKIHTGENYAEISLSENVNRAEMHPADEFAAYQKMVDEGSSIKDIACQFGTAQTSVKQRLKLAGVSPLIMQAFKNDDLSLDCVMAFTVKDNHEDQDACFKALEPHKLSPYAIKNMLLNDCISARDPLALFVGLKAYKKAGGNTTIDMFSNETHLQNSTLLFSLAQTKLDEVKSELLAQQWKWVEYQLEGTPNLTGFHIIKATPTNVPEELTTQIHRLTKRSSELDDIDFDDWTDELEKEYDDIDVKLESLENTVNEYAIFRQEDIQIGGCIVYIRHDGQVAIEKGLVKREDWKKQKTITNESDVNDENDSVDTVSDAYPQTLQQDIQLYKQQIIKSKLAADAEYAQDLLTFTLSRKLLLDGWFNSSLGIQVNKSDQETKLNDLSQTMAGQALSDIYRELKLDFLREETDLACFQVFRALDKKDKSAISAYVTAIMFTLSEPATDNHIANDLQIEYANMWRPSNENFFARLRKEKLLSLGQSWLGDEWAKTSTKQKKSVLCESLHAIFHDVNHKNSDIENISTQWLPDGFLLEK